MTGQSELPHDPVERGGAALGAADVVSRARRAPEHLQRPAIRATMQQAAQRQPHL